MTNEHWLQRDKKQTPEEEDKAAKQGIREMYEEAQRESVARQVKLVSFQERRYGS